MAALRSSIGHRSVIGYIYTYIWSGLGGEVTQLLLLIDGFVDCGLWQICLILTLVLKLIRV